MEACVTALENQHKVYRFTTFVLFSYVCRLGCGEKFLWLSSFLWRVNSTWHQIGRMQKRYFEKYLINTFAIDSPRNLCYRDRVAEHDTPILFLDDVSRSISKVEAMRIVAKMKLVYCLAVHDCKACILEQRGHQHIHSECGRYGVNQPSVSTWQCFCVGHLYLWR